MAIELPYLPTYKNVGKLFEKIKTAKVPDAFTHSFLYNTIGLKGASDRALISLLKKLGFLDANGKPSESYSVLKNKTKSSVAIAEGIKLAYKPLFDANEYANELETEELKGLVAQVAGTDEKQTKNIAYTFSALTKLGDFKGAGKKGGEDEEDSPLASEVKNIPKGLRHDFHFNIQVHLPSNGTEETYMNIFNALRKVLG